MNKLIYLTIFIVSFYVQLILASDHLFEIAIGKENLTVQVWAEDHVTIVAIDIAVEKWFFNNSLLAEFGTDGWIPSNSSISLLLNATASEENDQSLLTMNFVKRFHTGIYIAEELPNSYSVNMTVYGNNFWNFKYNFLSFLFV
jgi:hypothetical protein